jgi:hypothetical protein
MTSTVLGGQAVNLEESFIIYKKRKRKSSFSEIPLESSCFGNWKQLVVICRTGLNHSLPVQSSEVSCLIIENSWWYLLI